MATKREKPLADRFAEAKGAGKDEVIKKDAALVDRLAAELG